jgi:hypothetical protein
LTQRGLGDLCLKMIFHDAFASCSSAASINRLTLLRISNACGVGSALI